MLEAKHTAGCALRRSGCYAAVGLALLTNCAAAVAATPGGLPPGVVPTGGGILSEDRSTMGFIKRPDLARLVVEVLHDDGTINKTYAAIDPGLARPWDGADPE